MSKKKLKKCPFCGGEARLRKKNRTIINMETRRNCYAYCVECGARAERFVYEDFAGPRYFHDKAIEAWNERQQEANKWIPCSERLPDENEMKANYCRNKYGCEFIVMIDGANRPTTLYRTLDGFWVDDNREVYRVIAWQPLPEPYKEK